MPRVPHHISSVLAHRYRSSVWFPGEPCAPRPPWLKISHKSITQTYPICHFLLRRFGNGLIGGLSASEDWELRVLSSLESPLESCVAYSLSASSFFACSTQLASKGGWSLFLRGRLRCLRLRFFPIVAAGTTGSVLTLGPSNGWSLVSSTPAVVSWLILVEISSTSCTSRSYRGPRGP